MTEKLSSEGEARFAEGDVITVRGNTYTVDDVDEFPDGDVLQYGLDAMRDDLSGRLEPAGDGEYVICEYYSVDAADIEREGE